MNAVARARDNDSEWFETVLTTFILLLSADAFDVASFGVTAVSWARLFVWLHPFHH